MKTFLVVNPQSANGQTGRRWPELSAQIGRSLGTFNHAFTTGPMDAARLASQAIKDGHELVVAVGGDGTVNEVTNGFFEGGKALNASAALGVIPRGTGGDFRRTFQWEGDIASSVARLQGAKTQPFDVGLLEYTDPAGKSRTRCFANICSFGVSGLVDKTVNEGSKVLGGKLSFMLGSARAMLRYKDKKVRVSVDDATAQEWEITTLAVANGRYFGGGMCVAPHADTQDGLFDVTIWSGYTLLDFALKQKAMYDGTHLKFPGTRTLKCKSLSAQSDEEVLLDVDGEQPGRLPCRMTVLPGAIRLKV